VVQNERTAAGGTGREPAGMAVSRRSARRLGCVSGRSTSTGHRAWPRSSARWWPAYGHGPDHPPGHETRGWCSTRRPSTSWVDTAHVEVHRRTSVLFARNPSAAPPETVARDAAATRNSPPGRTAGRAGRVARERRGPDHEGTTPGPAGNPGV